MSSEFPCRKCGKVLSTAQARGRHEKTCPGKDQPKRGPKHRLILPRPAGFGIQSTSCEIGMARCICGKEFSLVPIEERAD